MGARRRAGARRPGDAGTDVFPIGVRNVAYPGVSANHLHGFGRVILQNFGKQAIEQAEYLLVIYPCVDAPKPRRIMAVDNMGR